MNERNNFQPIDFISQLRLKGFNAYKIGPMATGCLSYNPKEVYKISLNTGSYVFHYADLGMLPTLPMRSASTTRLISITFLKRKRVNPPNRYGLPSFDFYTFSFVFLYFSVTPVVTFAGLKTDIAQQPA